MKLYKLSNPGGDISQYVAHFDDEYMLCMNYVDGKLDTYNVLEIDDFEGIELEQPTQFNDEVCKLFIRFLFIKGFDGGDESDLT